MRKLFFYFLFQVFITVCAVAQKTESSGRVLDSLGNAISGASILEVNTKNGTTTDAAGYFKLSTSPNSRITISSVGYLPIEVAPGANLQITLRGNTSSEALKEVVITALGIRREKKALGYAVSSVGKEKLELRPEGDVARVLNGKAPGVNVLNTSGLSGSGTNIIIRGANSLSGSVTPLFIVDGVPFDGATNAQSDFRFGNSTSSRFLDIDPNNIENIDILKGLSATTLYGEQGRNGVILITTKNASTRKINKKAEVTVTQSLFANTPANLPEYQDTWGAGFQQLGTFAFSNWGARITSPPALLPHPYDRAALNAVFPEYIGKQYEYKAYNSIKDFFRAGQISNSSVNFNGSAGNTNYNTNFSYLNDQGFTPGNYLKRATFGIGGLSRLSNNFTISGTFNFSNTDMKAPPNGYSAGSGAVEGSSVFGDLIYTPRTVDLVNLPYENPVDHSSVYYRGPNDIQHPLWTIHNQYTQDKVVRTFGNLQLRYDISKNLNITYRLGYDKYTEENVLAGNKGAVDAWQTGIYRVVNGQNSIWDHTLLANFKTKFNEDFTLTVDAAANSREDSYNQNGLNSTEQLVYGLFDHSNFINHSILGESGVDLDFRSKFQTVSAFAQSIIGYRDFVYLTLGGRKSWVSSLEEGNNSKFYPNISASFLPLAAMRKDNGFVNYLKLRAGYSTSARFPENPYTTRPALNITTRLYVDRSGSVINSNAISNRLANKDLRPELQKEIELGFETKFFDNRASIDLTVYRRISKDQILDRSLDPSSGYTVVQVNAGNLRNKGLELAVGYNVIRSKNVSWTLEGNFALNRSLVYDIPSDIELLVLSGFSSQGTVAKNGYPLGMLYGTYMERDTVSSSKTKGQFLVDENGDYLVSSGSQIIGNPNPDYRISGFSTLRYKSLEFRMQWDFVKGGDIYTRTVATLLSRGLTTDTDFDRNLPVLLPGVRQSTGLPNDIQTTASNAYFNRYLGAAEANVFDGTCIRLRELALSYTLPASFISKTPFGSVSISLSGTNLWYNAINMPKGTNFDPETTSLGVGNSVGGFEYLTGPSSRRIGGSIRMTF